MTSYQYRKSHCGDKTILRPFYLHNGISYAGKISSLYWIRPQISFYQWDHLFIRMIAIGWWNEHIAIGWWNTQQLSIAFRIPCQYTAALNSTSITTLRPTSPRSSTFPTMMFSSVPLNSTHGWDNLWASADNSLKDRYLTRVGTSDGNLWCWNTVGSIRLQYDQPVVLVYPMLWYQFGNKHWPFDVLKKKLLKKIPMKNDSNKCVQWNICLRAWLIEFKMLTSSNESIFRVTGPLCREFTDPQWIPLTKASDAELWCFL